MANTQDGNQIYVPVFEKHAGEWYFYDLDGGRLGPYSTRERAEDKYWEYMAYVVEAPACHHPIPTGLMEGK